MTARVLLAALLCVGAPSASANIFDVYGMGARGLGMAGAQNALASDYTATFYNPAALARSPMTTFGAGFMFTVPLLNVTRALPVCLHGSGVCDQAFAGGYSDRESELPGAFSGFHVGWNLPFTIYEQRFAVGIVFYVPTINLVRAEGLDPQTPQFYMYQNLPDQLVLLASASYRPFDWMSLGVGIQVLADVFGKADFNVDAVNGDFESSDLSVELTPNAAIVAGLHFEPFNGLQLGVTYRQQHGLEFGIPARIAAGDAVVLGLDVRGSVLYRPHTIGFGASYRIAPARLTLAVQVDYALWSLAPDPSPFVAVTFSGAVLEGLGLDGALDVSQNAPPIQLGFSDTLTPRLGLEWEALDWFAIQAGYYYRPSPAPRATGPWNYLDNDVHALSLGLTFVFDDPFVAGRPITLGLGNQLGVLPRRTVIKANPDDPVGDLEHGGLTYSVSLTVNYSF